MITTALAFALLNRSELDFSHPIDRGEVVIKALGQELGLDLRASGELIEDRIFVRLRDTDWESAKPMLAEGLAATWSRNGDVLYLTRPTAAKPVAGRGDRIITEVKKWQDAIVIKPEYDLKALTEMLMQTLRDPQNSEDSRFESVFDNRSGFGSIADANPGGRQFLPTTRALLSIFKMIDPEVIADIADSQARVASIRPLARDIRLPSQAAGVLERFIREREILRQVLEITGVKSSLDSGNSVARAFIDSTALVVKVFGDRQYVRLELCVQKGSATDRVAVIEMYIEDTSWGLEGDPVPGFMEVTTPLNLTADELAIGKFFVDLRGWPKDMIPNEWMDDLGRGRTLAADPVTNERLELICGPVLRQLSDAQEMSVVALLSDSLYQSSDWLAPSDKGRATVAQALEQMITGNWRAPYTILEKSGYWLLTPTDLERHENSRFDRRAYRDAIAFVENSRWFDIAYWRLAFSRMEDPDQLTELYFEMQSYFDGAPGFAQYDVLSLLANLSGADLELARNGQLYAPLSSLSKEVQRMLTKGAVESTLTSKPSRYDRFGRLVDDVGIPISLFSKAKRSDGADQGADGLFAFRRGIPAGAVAKIDYFREPLFHAKTPGIEDAEMKGMFRMMSVDTALEHAYSLVGIDRNLKPDSEIPRVWNWDVVYVSYKDVFRVTVDWPGLGYSEHKYEMSITPADFNWLPLESLPADVREYLDRAIVEIRAQNERFRRAAGGGGGR